MLIVNLPLNKSIISSFVKFILLQFSVAFSVLVYLALFNPWTVETSTYVQEKQKIDSLSYVITNLQKDQAKVKSEIDSHKSNYENLVDKATFEIESFIKKHEVDTKAQ